MGQRREGLGFLTLPQSQKLRQLWARRRDGQMWDKRESLRAFKLFLRRKERSSYGLRERKGLKIQILPQMPKKKEKKQTMGHKDAS
jgi:hypothetical protein